MAMLVIIVLLAGMASPPQPARAAEDPAALARAAQAAERQNDFPAAVRIYRLLATQFPHNAEVQSNLGVALYFNHQLPQALDTLRKAIALDPDLLAPHLFSGLAWFRLSNPDAAVPELERAVRINPSDVLARTWLGYAYTAQWQYQPAVKQFEAASELDPANLDVWYALGEAWLQIGENAIYKLLATAPDGARVWELAGEQCQLRGQNRQALEDYEQAYARRPGISGLRILIVNLGGTPKAAVTDASAVDPGAEDALYAEAHHAEEESAKAFDKVVRLDPDSYRAHEILADSLVARGHDLQAIQEYRAVLKLKPDLPDIHEEIGKALLRSGRMQEALQEFQAELQIQPESAAAHMYAGRVLLMQGHDEAAGKMLTAALHEDRPPLETWVLMAKIDLRHDEAHKAIPLLAHYVSQQKQDSTAYYLLFLAYRDVGDREGSRQAMEMYLKTSRDRKERNAARKQLELIQDAMRIPDDPSQQLPSGKRP